jgi:hypothetical protein
MVSNEEEIRIESEKQLAFIQKEAGIKLEGVGCPFFVHFSPRAARTSAKLQIKTKNVLTLVLLFFLSDARDSCEAALVSNCELPCFSCPGGID